MHMVDQGSYGSGGESELGLNMPTDADKDCITRIQVSQNY